MADGVPSRVSKVSGVKVSDLVSTVVPECFNGTVDVSDVVRLSRVLELSRPTSLVYGVQLISVTTVTVEWVKAPSEEDWWLERVYATGEGLSEGALGDGDSLAGVRCVAFYAGLMWPRDAPGWLAAVVADVSPAPGSCF